eukprot:Platyproteum_vivax@DN13645_c0_g1_i1.p2
MKAPFYKTKMCQAFHRGGCVSGDTCMWAHSYDELEPVSVEQYAQCSVRTITPQVWLHTATAQFYRTSLCLFWKKGRCFMGSSCRYAHGSKELTQFQTNPKHNMRVPPPPPPPPMT